MTCVCPFVFLLAVDTELVSAGLSQLLWCHLLLVSGRQMTKPRGQTSLAIFPVLPCPLDSHSFLVTLASRPGPPPPITFCSRPISHFLPDCAGI